MSNSSSQFSSSSINTRQVYEYGEWIPVKQCRFGHEMKLKTSWTADNPGRRFWRCLMSGSVADCGYMECFDPPMCKRCMKIIPGLLRRINLQEEEIKTLENKLKGVDGVKKIKCSKEMLVVFLVIVLFVVVVVLVKISPSGDMRRRQLLPIGFVN